jgi:hypothetical protein
LNVPFKLLSGSKSDEISSLEEKELMALRSTSRNQLFNATEAITNVFSLTPGKQTNKKIRFEFVNRTETDM